MLFYYIVTSSSHGIQLYQASRTDCRHVRQSRAELQLTIPRRSPRTRPAIRAQSSTRLPIRRPTRPAVRFLWPRTVLLSGSENASRRTGWQSSLLAVRSSARPHAVPDTRTGDIRARQGNGTYSGSVSGVLDRCDASQSQHRQKSR